MGDSGARLARRGRRWVVRVTAIDPLKYPDFRKNPDTPFIRMEPDQRIEEIVSFCARLWARTCEDAARQQKSAAQLWQKVLTLAA